MTKIVCNSFVHRQTPDSQFSHFAGSWEKLEALAETYFDQAKPGYKPGVWLVPVPATDFFTGIVEVGLNTQLVAKLVSRRDGELPYIEVTAKGPKAVAGAVDLVVYSKEVLEADASAIPADFEIVSINARLSPRETEPMHPMTMARNFLGWAGGTKAEYTAAQFANSIAFWSQHAMRHE